MSDFTNSVLKNRTFTRWLQQLPRTTELCFAELHPALAAALVSSEGHNPSGITLFFAENPRLLQCIRTDISSWLPDAIVFQPSEIPAQQFNSGIHFFDYENHWLCLLNQLVSAQQKTQRNCIIIFGTPQLLQQKLPSPTEFLNAKIHLKAKQHYDISALVKQLDQAGYLRVQQVDAPAQYAVRGCIIDIFSTDATVPVRIEWDDNLICGIWNVDLLSQRRTHQLAATAIYVEKPESNDLCSTLKEYLPYNSLIIHIGSNSDPLPTPLLTDNAVSKTGSFDTIGFENRTRLLFATIDSWLKDNWTIHIAVQNQGERKRLGEILALHDPSWPSRITLHTLPVAHGFTLPEEKFSFLTDAEIFCRCTTNRVRLKSELSNSVLYRKHAREIIDELNEGDLVVHSNHGIGRYVGIHTIDSENCSEEVIILEYANSAKLYVPLSKAHLISRYVGTWKKPPSLDCLGTNRWQHVKKSAQRAIYDFASKLLTLQAQRQVHSGHAFAADTSWQKEFENAAPFTLTADQLAALSEVKKDMESPRPMDRLLCGDVGFGKTEVAIRAAFKAVMDGKQVALMCPTSVLVRQHFLTFSQRMCDYPINIRMLSRLQDLKTTHRVIEELATGVCDIVIGTHRLLSPDVAFCKLGLLIIDEEQRFGVRHKERLKERFPTVDILTLSATPIPRTLYLALMGARDISLIETPPPGRIAVDTHIVPYDERLIRDAILREINRGGQVFFLHNRIASIERVCSRLRELVPNLRVLTAHGKMHKDDLEKTLSDFIDGKADVLVTTTIIESGIDMPNVNTIFIDRADRFGLADLYQLRGRVGRSHLQAHAYLFFPPHSLATGNSRRRAATIKQYQQLGSGFKIAMRDLEIRGAGNLLGTEQSGHLNAIGFDLYCRLLKEAVQQLKTGKITFNREVFLNLDFVVYGPLSKVDTQKVVAYIPSHFLEDTRQRISAYRQLAELSSTADWLELRARWEDLYGKFPLELQNLLAVHLVRCTALDHGLTSVECKQSKIFLFKGKTLLLNGKSTPRLISENPCDWLEEICYWIRRLSPANTPPFTDSAGKPQITYSASTTLTNTYQSTRVLMEPETRKNEETLDCVLDGKTKNESFTTTPITKSVNGFHASL